MTVNKDFKRLVRARAARTGEPYSTARRRLLAALAGDTEQAMVSRKAIHRMNFDRVIPILRIFDADKAKEFYVDYLGMKVHFEHRFESDLPLYMQVSRGSMILHLSEHHGDGTPGTTVYVRMTGVQEFHSELSAKRYGNLRPGIETDEIGTHVDVLDPFGNTLRFNERFVVAEVAEPA